MKISIIKNRRGFTAIELLFVILAIGILAATSVMFLGSSRAKARDAKRLVDVRRIQTALEFYNLENDAYPIASAAITLGSAQFTKLCDAASGGFVPADKTCVTTYMSPIPTDPSSGNYLYLGAKDGYALKFHIEKNSTLGSAGTYYAHSKTIDLSAQTK